MNRPRRFPLKAWLKYRFGDRSWLVLAAAAGLAGLTVLLLTVPIGRSQGLDGEVVAFGVDAKWSGRSAVVRLASGETRVVSLPRTATCAKGDRLRIIETPFLTGARFDAAPEACGRKPGSGGAST